MELWNFFCKETKTTKKNSYKLDFSPKTLDFFSLHLQRLAEVDEVRD